MSRGLLLASLLATASASAIGAGCDPATPPAADPVPEAPEVPVPPTGGAELIGRAAAPWTVGPWFNSPPLDLADLRGRVVFVRWFMDPSCPFCSGSAPELRALDEHYRDRGLTVVGMYHHKADESLDPADVRGWVDHYRYRFPVAIDDAWKTLKAWWLDGVSPERSFTSVSFLIDRKGVIRYIHPGGLIDPASDEARAIEARVEALLAEAP